MDHTDQLVFQGQGNIQGWRIASAGGDRKRRAINDDVEPDGAAVEEGL